MRRLPELPTPRIRLRVEPRLFPAQVMGRCRAIQIRQTQSRAVRFLVQPQVMLRIHQTPVPRVPFPVFPVLPVPFPEPLMLQRPVLRILQDLVRRVRRTERVPLAPEGLEDRELVSLRLARPKTRFKSSARPCPKGT